MPVAVQRNPRNLSPGAAPARLAVGALMARRAESQQVAVPVVSNVLVDVVDVQRQAPAAGSPLIGAGEKMYAN